MGIGLAGHYQHLFKVRVMSKDKNRILVMANYSNITGFAWNNIYELFNYVANYFIDKGDDCYISFAEISRPIDKEKFSGFKEYFILEPNSLNPNQLFLIRRVLLTKKIKVIYLTDQPHFSCAYFLYRLWGVKKIIVHSRVSVASPDAPLPETGIKGYIKWILARVPLFNCDKIYAVSDFVKYRLVHKAKVPNDNVEVILNGIDTEKFKPSTQNRSGVVKIFTCGRATLHKGFQFLFEAAFILVAEKKIKNFIIDYAGDGPDMDYLKNIVNEKNISSYVNFLGETTSTHELQCGAEIIVVPSIWGDACPSSVSEALASGKPLVATRAGGIPEMIGADNCAIIVPHSDPYAIASALENLIEDESLRSRLAVSARIRAVTALNKSNYYEKVISSLERDMRR